MDVILDIFKDKLFCFCVLYLKTLKKKVFSWLHSFSMYFILKPNSGLP